MAPYHRLSGMLTLARHSNATRKCEYRWCTRCWCARSSVCVHAYVCARVCIYSRLHTIKHTHKPFLSLFLTGLHAHIQQAAHAFTRTHTYTRTHIHVHTHIHWTCTHIHMHTHIHTQPWPRCNTSQHWPHMPWLTLLSQTSSKRKKSDSNPLQTFCFINQVFGLDVSLYIATPILATRAISRFTTFGIMNLLWRESLMPDTDLKSEGERKRGMSSFHLSLD